MKKLLSAHIQVTPPGGWRFSIPEELSPRLKGTEVQAATLHELNHKVHSLFHNNGESLNWKQYESLLCNQLPKNYCESCGDKGIEWRNHEPLTAKKILAFFCTMMLWWRRGHGLVNDEVAKRRYAKCKGCPHAVQFNHDLEKDGCPTCGAEGAARKFLKEKVQNRTDLTEGEPTLYCTLCGCDLSIKCYFDIVSDCWKDVDNV